MKILDYDGFKQVITKIKDLIDKKADKTKVVTSVNGQKGDMMVDFFVGDDTRYLTYTPKDYLRDGVRFKSNTNSQFEFKRCTTVGVDRLITQDYCIVNTHVPWHDKIGGLPTQIAYGKGVMAIRTAIDENTWGEWQKVSTSTDLPTRLSQLSEDATHRIVTDKEKHNWNSKLEVYYSEVEENPDNLLDYKTIYKGYFLGIAPTGGSLSGILFTSELPLDSSIGQIFISHEHGIVMCRTKNIYGNSSWSKWESPGITYNEREKLSNLKQQVILTESQYNALSSTQKNDASKIYFIKA